MSFFYPKKGELVAVCYDGKISRWVPGTVLQTKSNRVLVSFVEWAGKDILNVWFPRRNLKDNFCFGGWAKVEKSVMRGLFGKPGNWYTLYPMSLIQRLGYDNRS